jgi:kinesin family protein 4/21/27
MGTTGDDVDYAGTDFTPRTGLIPRTVHAIFEKAEEIRQFSGPGATWECRISFLELYNEEIIDILSGTGVQVAIREEKDGRIIWSGVREVKVKTLAEVMGLLQEGSTRRRTGETGMNATSSRSHAIFSLTMVQKRRLGMSSSASQPSIDAGSSRMRRPNSMLAFNTSRSTTPSGTRSTTPSGSRGPPTAFSTQHQNKSSLPRPNSMQISPLTKDEDMMVVTSKFNMVDLAGSERLKRTAAQGERMKEGISINSGLLALGNVISHCKLPQSRVDM